MKPHTVSFASAQSSYDAMLPPEDDHEEAVECEAERIAADADKVRELVLDSLDATDSPVMSNDWTADLLIALRESGPIIALLCKGYTLEDAMDKASGADHFRTLLRCGDTADTWIAKVIDQAASQAVDDAIADAKEYRAEAARDARDMEGWA